jgi:NADH:ubiquinone oxidoreductase subunit 6 (chain J)
MSGNQAVFLALASLACFGAMGVVVFGKNPVRSALCLVLNFFVLGLVYFTLGSQLLGISQILVYAGAIMVLFLFVIMMLQQQTAFLKAAERDGRGPLAALVGVTLFAMVFTTVLTPLSRVTGTAVPDHFGTPQSVGKVLFTTYAWPFLLSSVLLLVGIVGSILLAKRRI